MEEQPGQSSSPYSQYPQYPSPAEPYGAGQPPYSSPNQPAYPGQPPYSSPNQPTYPAYPAQPPYSSPNQPAYPVPPQSYPYGGAPGPNFPPPQRRKNYLWLIIVAAVLVVVLFAAVFAVVQGKNNGGSIASQPTATAQASSVPTTAPTQQGSQPTQQPTVSSTGTHKIGDVVSIDNWLVTVNGVKLSQGGQYDTPRHAGDVYLEIDVSVTNQTGQSQTFSSLLSLTLKDSTGQKYDETFVSDAPSPPDGTVANGSKLRGTVVYEVPSNMHSFEFDVAPESLTSTDVAVWNLSV